MTSLRTLLIIATLASPAAGADYKRLIFADDFSADGFGKAWGHYKSSSVVKDGVLVGITAPTSDHNAVDHVRIEPERDLEVAVKFRYVSDKAKGFNVWLDDKNYKGSHAGHICSIAVYPTSVVVADAKEGNFRNDIYEQRKANPKLAPELTEYLKTRTAKFPVKLALQDWHTLVVRTAGDEVVVEIDGKDVGSFKSPGIAHDSKTLVSLTTNQVDVHYDDFSIKGLAKP